MTPEIELKIYELIHNIRMINVRKEIASYYSDKFWSKSFHLWSK